MSYPFFLSTAASGLQGMACQPHAGSFPAATQLLLPLLPNQCLAQFLQQPTPTSSLNSWVKITAGKSWSQLLLASRPSGQWDKEKDGKYCLCLGQKLCASMQCSRTRACCTLYDDYGNSVYPRQTSPFTTVSTIEIDCVFQSVNKVKECWLYSTTQDCFTVIWKETPWLFTMEKSFFNELITLQLPFGLPATPPNFASPANLLGVHLIQVIDELIEWDWT